MNVEVCKVLHTTLGTDEHYYPKDFFSNKETRDCLSLPINER